MASSSSIATQVSESHHEVEVELVIHNNTNSIISSANKHEHSHLIIGNHSLMFLNSNILPKFHAGYFRIALSLCGQALLWKTLIETTNYNTNITLIRHVLHMLHHYPIIFFVLWFLSLFILLLLSLLYILKSLFFFDMIKIEFMHHVGVNFLFTPFISWLLLIQSSPIFAQNTLIYSVLWWLSVVPIVLLDVKIYGQWFTTKGKNRVLTNVANPTSQLSVIGNLIGAQGASKMGLKEGAIFLFSIGIVHYLVLFVTLYQRLSSIDYYYGVHVLLRPALFLFFGAPCVACLAWESIIGHFDVASKMMFFLSLFIFISLKICRPILFKKTMKSFSVTWWTYSFPLTVLALASTKYAQQVEGTISHIIMIFLLFLSFLVSFALIVFTMLNSKMLLPENDPIGTLLIHN